METYTVYAYLPHEGYLAAKDSKGQAGLLTTEGFRPMFPRFVEAAILKYHYIPLNPPKVVREDGVAAFVRTLAF